MNFSRKDLLSTKDLTKEEILSILDTAETFFELNRKNVKKADTLRGKTVINLFLEKGFL